MIKKEKNPIILQIINENLEDLYKKLKMYIGPFQNFYHIKYNINHFILNKELEFHFINGNVQNYIETFKL